MDDKKFRKLKKLAKRNGWAVPSFTDPFNQDVWMRYWAGMAEYRADNTVGRPIIPHRSGGGQRF